MQTRNSFHNKKTFLHLTETETIPAVKLLVLDGYAFDIDELEANAQHDISQFYRNPYIVDRGENNRFSAPAINQLRAHPLLSRYAQTLDEMLATQTSKITKETVDAVLVLLRELEQLNQVNNEMARAKFYEYFLTLNDSDQLNLNNYIINMNLTGGGVQPLNFNAALAGGSEVTQCVIVTRLYLWQFVIDFRPAEIIHIPAATLAMMSRSLVRIQPKAAYALPPLAITHEDPTMIKFFNDLIRRREGVFPYFDEEEEKQQLERPRNLFVRHHFFQKPDNSIWEQWLRVMIVTPDRVSFVDADFSNLSTIIDILFTRLRTPLIRNARETHYSLFSTLTDGEAFIARLNDLSRMRP